MRVFFALWPGADLQHKLFAWGAAMHQELGGRPTRAESIHLTLAFIGEVPAEKLPTIQRIGDLQSAAAFDLTIDRVGCWKHNGIAWAGSQQTSASLLSLVKDLRRMLAVEKLFSEEREFAVHLTLLRKVRCVRLKWQVPDGMVWNVQRFSLMDSVPRRDGSSYSEISSWDLKTTSD